MTYDTITQHEAETMAFEVVAIHDAYAHHCDIDPLSWRAAQLPHDIEELDDGK